MSKYRSKKLTVFQLTIVWTVGVLIALVLFLFLLGKLSYYFYLKELGHVDLLKSFFSQSLKNTIASSTTLLLRNWRLLYQARILIIVALIVSFPFVRRFARRTMSNRVKNRSILKRLYHLAPWVRVLILTALIWHYILYGLAKQLGEIIAKENVTLWTQYIAHCESGAAAHIQTLTLNNQAYRCAYIIAIKNQNVLFFADKKLHVFDIKTNKKVLAWNIKNKISDDKLSL
jgi:hypothetical protein